MSEPLPAAVRQQLLIIASDVIGRRPVSELPASLRRFARFTPAKRLRLGAADIAASLESEPGLRDLIADVVIQASPELAEQVRAGTAPATADPLDVAVIAYLLRPPSWQTLVDRAGAEIADSEAQRADAAELDRLRQDVARLELANRQLSEQRDAARGEARADIAERDRSITDLSQRLRAVQAELRQARREVADAEATVSRLSTERDRAGTAQLAELRQARAQVASLRHDLDAARRAARTDRDHDAARVWLLLEQLGAAVSGLRRELDVVAPGVTPADGVATSTSASGPGPSTLDVGLLSRLLDGAHVHLIVDGYNITKTGYGQLPLADQRARLIGTLGALAARTQVEVTAAFDGTAAPLGAVTSVPVPRGVRVLFSARGELADDLIRTLLAAEPAGRTVIVASSDAEVAASARAARAWPVSADVLLTRLERV